MVCSDCSKFSDVDLKLAEVKLSLTNVRKKLGDAQKLNFVLERYSLTLENKLLASQSAYRKLEKLVETLTRSRIVDIPESIVKTEESDHDSNGSADEEDENSSHSDGQSSAMDGANSDYQEDSSDDQNTDVDEKVFANTETSMIQGNRKIYNRGIKRRKSSSAGQPRRRTSESNVKRPELKSKDQEYIRGSKYHCTLCSFEDIRASKFYAHVRTHDGYRPFKCNFIGCSKTFNRLDSLKSHENTHPWEEFDSVVVADSEPPKAVEVRQPQPPPSEVKTWDCDLCSFSSIYSSKFASHVRDHPGYKPFKCDADGCSQSFTHLHTFERHQRLHTGECPYVCQHEGCSMAFDTQKKILKHIRTVHKEQMAVSEPVIRDFDGPSTSRDGDISRGVDTDDELPSAFVQRTRRAPSRGNLGYIIKRKDYVVPSRALRDTVLGGEMKYNCEHCDFASNFHTFFFEHAKKHPGYDRPFKCPHLGCFKTYKRGEVLARHLPVHSGEKKIHCQVDGCGMSFKFRAGLEYHEWKMHREIAKHKGVECSVAECKKLFFSKPNLASHVRSVHPQLVPDNLEQSK